MTFYLIPIFALLRVSQGFASTNLCYASSTIWTSIGGNKYAQRNICDRDSNSRPPGSDTMLVGLPLSIQLYKLDDIEEVRWPFIRFQHKEADPKRQQKGNPVHIAPASTELGKGSDHLVSYVCRIFLYFYKRLFPVLEPMTSCSQGNNFTTTRLPLKDNHKSIIRKIDISSDWVTNPGNSETGIGASPRINTTCIWMCL
jgi:hypothetical protein